MAAHKRPGDGEQDNPAGSPKTSSDGRLAISGKKRTRTGCLNCRKKRRKCDETKPTCGGCQTRREACQWGLRLSFRPENAQHMDVEHPSMRKGAAYTRSGGFQIVDVTPEIIRDYSEETVQAESITDDVEADHAMVDNGDTSFQPLGTTGSLMRDPITPALTDLTPAPSSLHNPSFSFLSPQWSDSVFEDGIFLPGSQYQELHAELRSRIIETARSTVPSRFGTPDVDLHGNVEAVSSQAQKPADDDEESRRLAHLSPEQECVLWQNYLNEVASWLDKFDNDRHFELVLPMLAKIHPHLKYSILALSARQLERKEQKLDYSCSLALYSHAIHLLSPLLQKRTTDVLASCVVLCVLEMLSCSPKAWKRHLDGCAALIQALGLHGASGGLEQALFWVFARMDICGGLIGSEKTLIPVQKWMPGHDMQMDMAMLKTQAGFDMYANQMVYLTGRVVDLLCSSGKWEQKLRKRSSLLDVVDYAGEWTELFQVLESWYNDRPGEMRALLVIPSDGQDPNKPFSTLLFGNGPATSGNQMYHTSALLLLQHKPASVQFTRKPHSILWHARQIVAVSTSNTHHGCWTNSTQPLWIAGQQMSHPTEHKVILDIYERIERETGWATKWRADDLRDHWGIS